MQEVEGTRAAMVDLMQFFLDGKVFESNIPNLKSV